MSSTSRARRVKCLAAGVVALAVLPATAGMLPAAAAGQAQRPGSAAVAGEQRLVVRTDGDAALERRVAELGGRVTRRLPLISGYAVTLPSAAVPRLAALPGVRTVTPDARVRLLGTLADGYDPATDYGSMDQITSITGARSGWKSGYTGKGVDVALVDSGVAPVQGLTSGNVVDGPDLSFESQSPALTHLDTFGHGTHMASIIAGRDVVRTGRGYASSTTDFLGMAPDARVLSIKVAAMDGATDVSQVIAAIDWVSVHARDPGLNIRVLNLSFGTDSEQDWRYDPLSYAVQAAWQRGLVVVVAGGNDGTTKTVLADPARNPVVLAAGAQDPQGTASTSDDTVPDFATRGTSSRHVDLVAPAVHVLGLRVPGGYLDDTWPTARVGSRFFRGSGTSQGAAVVSGAAALLLQKTPGMTPDDVKRALMASADPFPGSSDIFRGSGALDVRNALVGAVANGNNNRAAAYGTGTLEGARGSAHVTDGTAELTGEQDIMGAAWDGAQWSTAAAAGKTWTGGTWNGKTWTGSAWSSSGWTGKTWTSATWTGKTWTGKTWTGDGWTGKTWTGKTWTGDSWTGKTWTGNGWSASTWSSAGWR